MKRNLLIANLVLFFCLCALNINNYAYAQENKSLISAENQTNINSQASIEVLDIMERVSKYSEASPQEIKAICDYYGVDGNLFKDLEAKGYDLKTSSKVVELNSRYNIDLKTIEEYIQQGKDLDSLYPQSDINNSSQSDSTETPNEYIKEITPPKELEENYEQYVNPQDGSYTYKPD